MASRWSSAAVVAALVAATPLAGQQPHELGIQATITGSDPVLGVLGGYGALRTSLRTRVSAAIGAGLAGDRAGWRGELLGHFLLSPTRLRGRGFYAAAGVAGAGARRSQGYVVLTFGVEGRPAGAGGWFLEAGIGGGARVSAGYRWRSFPLFWPE